MVLVVLTLQHMENLKTTPALTKYKDGLGGEKCVDFLKAKASEGSRKTARTKGRTYHALELHEIVNVEYVFGGLYSAAAPTGNKRRRR